MASDVSSLKKNPKNFRWKWNIYVEIVPVLNQHYLQLSTAAKGHSNVDLAVFKETRAFC